MQVLIVVLIALPALAEYRQRAAELLRIPLSAIWIPLLAILLIVDFIILKRLHTYIGNPLRHLVKQTKLGSASFAFKKKSMNFEEDHLKHFIESQALKVNEMEQEVNRMEVEVDRAVSVSKVSPEELDALEQKLEKATLALEGQLKQLADSDNARTQLEREVESLKRSLKEANRELDALKREATAREEEGEEASFSSILVEKLKDPLTLINNLSWRLAKAWADTPMTQMREGLEEISKQSEEQLELLKKYRVSPPREERQERKAR